MHEPQRKYDYLTGMSKPLAEKLDALTNDEWEELTRCMTDAFRKAAEERGVHLIKTRRRRGS